MNRLNKAFALSVIALGIVASSASASSASSSATRTVAITNTLLAYSITVTVTGQSPATIDNGGNTQSFSVNPGGTVTIKRSDGQQLYQQSYSNYCNSSKYNAVTCYTDGFFPVCNYIHGVNGTQGDCDPW